MIVNDKELNTPLEEITLNYDTKDLEKELTSMKYMCELLEIKDYAVVTETKDYIYVIIDNKENYKRFKQVINLMHNIKLPPGK